MQCNGSDFVSYQRTSFAFDNLYFKKCYNFCLNRIYFFHIFCYWFGISKCILAPWGKNSGYSCFTINLFFLLRQLNLSSLKLVSYTDESLIDFFPPLFLFSWKQVQ